MEFDNNNEQPERDSTVNENQPGNTSDSGSNKEIDYKAQYEALMPEFTKKSQKLSELEKNSISDEDKNLLAKARELGLSDENKFTAVKQEKEISEFKSTFNTLNDSQLKIVEDLKKANPNKDVVEIAQEYGLIKDAEYANYKKTKGIMGGNIALPKEKPKPTLTQNARKAHNIKGADEINKIRSTMGI